MQKQQDSDYTTISRHFHIRISDINLINTVREYIINNENRITYGLIGNIEESQSKNEHFHVALSFKHQTTGRAILVNMFGDFKNIAHYIHHKYSKNNEGEGESEFDNGTQKSFYGYVKKNGIIYEQGIPSKDKFKIKIKEETEKETKTKIDSYDKKVLLTRKARELGNKNEFRKWAEDNGFLTDLYSPWVDKMIKIECKENMEQAKARWKKSGNTDVRCIYVRDDGGTGKTFILNTLFPHHFPLDITSEYCWENYDSSNPDHGVVVIDELDTLTSLRKIGGTEFLRKLFDNDPVSIKTKWNNGESYVRPHTVILINNIELNQLIDEEFNRNKQSNSGKIIDAVYRRFTKQRSLRTAEFAAEFGKQLVHDGYKMHETTNRKWMINPKLIDIPAIYEKLEPRIINNEYQIKENEILFLKHELKTAEEIINILKEKLKKYNDNSILINDG